MMLTTGTIVTGGDARHIEACMTSLRRVCRAVLAEALPGIDRKIERVVLLEPASFLMLAPVRGRISISPGATRGTTRSLSWMPGSVVDDKAAPAIHTLSSTDPPEMSVWSQTSHIGKRWIRGPGFFPTL